MLVEKVPWCTHDGGVYTIHVQASGQRFATGGADSQVKVWSMAPVLDVRKEGKGGPPLVLATLCDHSSTVNTVRFSKNGRYLASGSDDRMICVCEHKAGPGGTTLGGGSAPNVENWRTKAVLRGHSNNVADLGWSHDDSRLASCSIDNSVCIWDPVSGQRLRTLDYHTSFVKGLAWDPVGTYLATQSEDKSVVIWRCDDWSVAARVTAPYAKLVTSTFTTRMSWSPEGSFLATGNSYQGSSHAAVVVQRGLWNDSKQHMLVSGHQGCVVSVGFNPRLFHLPKKEGAVGEVEEKLSSVFALGSQDKRISVWAAAQPTPMAVGKHFFRSQVTDLSWSPDGHTLLAASSDGTVACFQFAPSELGKPHTQGEMDQIFQQLYGSTRGAVGGKRLFAESADQLALEALAEASPRGAGLPTAPLPLPALAGTAAAAAGGKAAAAQQQQGSGERALQPSAKQNLDALDARLSGRMGGAGGSGEIQLGFDAPVVGEGPAPIVPAAAAGRKRLVPESIGQQQPVLAGSAGLMPPPPPRPSGGGQQEAKRTRVDAAAGTAARPSHAAAGSGRALVAAAGPSAAGGGTLAEAAAAGAAPAGMSVAAKQQVMLRRPGLPAEVVVNLGSPPRLFEDPHAPAAAGDAHRRQLRVTNRDRGGGLRRAAEVECTQGPRGGGAVPAPVWSDTLRGAAVAACGTHNFAAVGLEDGQLMVYSRAGRHLAAPLKLGAGIARLACDSAWRLLVLTTSGGVRLFDVESMRSMLSASLAPLLEGECTVLDARLSRQGVPLVTLSDSRAYVWNADLEGWACVADESFAASQFMPFMNLPGQGELSSLQAEALRAIPRAALPSLQIRGAAAQQLATRTHLEASMSNALALQSPQEYRRWLMSYAHFLTQQGDADRLAEVCAALLGGTDSGSSDATETDATDDFDYDMLDAAAAAAAGGAEQDPLAADAEAAAAAAGGSAGGARWQSTVLGMPKHELLREVLKEMSRNRGLQRTTQTYLDALTEMERAAQRAAEAAAQRAAQQATEAAAQRAAQRAADGAAAVAAAAAAAPTAAGEASGAPEPAGVA